jgi:hypothetical protein
MPWATAPVRTNIYRLYAGPQTAQLTRYAPGSLHTITVETTVVGAQYRGLQVYAVDSDELKVRILCPSFYLKMQKMIE